MRVTRYQRTDTVYLAEITCLWYGSFHTRTVRVILLRDDTTDTGYDLALVTTDLTSSPADLITRYAMRWSIEVTFAEARDLFGAGQAQNRTRTAVERTVPFALYCYTITVVWYTLHGHQPGDVAEYRERAPWSGRPGESHPRAPTEPCVKISLYTALVILVTRPQGRCSARPSGRRTWGGA